MQDELSPELFETLYSYRDYEEEVDFIELCWQQFSQTDNSNVLDIACGIGEHLRQLAARGYRCNGIDFDPNLIAYSTAKFAEEGLPISVHRVNISNFKLEERFGLAINMLATFNTLLTNQEIISHLRSVAAALDAGGIYIIEMFHPREYGFHADPPYHKWDVQDGDLLIECQLRYHKEPLDPLTQQQRSSTRVVVTRDEETQTYLMPRRHRIYLNQEFRSLVCCAGGFEIVEVFGSTHTDRKLDNSRNSWRMIPVLRRTKEVIV